MVCPRSQNQGLAPRILCALASWLRQHNAGSRSVIVLFGRTTRKPRQNHAAYFMTVWEIMQEKSRTLFPASPSLQQRRNTPCPLARDQLSLHPTRISVSWFLNFCRANAITVRLPALPAEIVVFHLLPLFVGVACSGDSLGRTHSAFSAHAPHGVFCLYSSHHPPGLMSPATIAQADGSWKYLHAEQWSFPVATS